MPFTYIVHFLSFLPTWSAETCSNETNWNMISRALYVIDSIEFFLNEYGELSRDGYSWLAVSLWKHLYTMENWSRWPSHALRIRGGDNVPCRCRVPHTQISKSSIRSKYVNFELWISSANINTVRYTLFFIHINNVSSHKLTSTSAGIYVHMNVRVRMIVCLKQFHK